MSGPFAAESKRGMVVSPHHQATAAGAQALRDGGTAADAIIATNAVLTVVYPHMCAIGGDIFVLGHSPNEGLFGLNGSGRAAALATVDWYRSRGLEAIPFQGPEAALTVPGCIDGWWTLHRRFGKLPWSRVLAPAIEAAENGFEVSPGLAKLGPSDLDGILNSAQLTELFTVDGGFVPEGTVVKQPALAATLRAIALGGPDAFYRGDIARRMSAAFEADGSPLRYADLAAHATNWFEPVRVPYRDYEAAALPPNTQGLVFLEAMRILEAFDVKSMGQGSPDLIHHQVEALKLAIADRNRWIGDEERSRGVVERMLGDGHIKEQRDKVRATAGAQAVSGSGDTCYFCAVDGDGLALSCIESVYAGFGACYVAGDTGVIIQDRGASFNFKPGHPNELEPGRRPMHTLTPAMLLQGGKPRFVFGQMGGGAQPQFLTQMAQSFADFGLDAPATISAPRFTYGPLFVGEEGALTVEAGLSGAVAALTARGHRVLDPLDEFSDNMGHASGIHARDDGMLIGGADPRADSAAIGI